MRFIVFLVLTFASSCAASDDGLVQEANEPDAVFNSSADTSAFRFDETKQLIYLDTRVATPQRRRFDIVLGSITVETVNIKDDMLTFRYTPEIEGGYTIYECTVPVSPVPIEFEINADGTPGKTSFDLSRCKLIRSGNVLLE